MIAQPTGTVTLLFTDIEGSTKLLERLGADAYTGVLQLHRRLLLQAFEGHAGYPVDEEGDALFVAFARAEDAVAAAADGQRALAGASWPPGVEVRVRVGIHSGEPLAVPPNYVGMDVHRAARIMAAGHGGQVLVSGATRALLDGVALIDLGPHRLKDMLEPIHLYQLVIDGLPREFPPLKSLHRSNLPIAAWPIIGRDEELAALRGLVSDGARLITLTGPGGTGKSRLALQAAAELSDGFAGGTFFVPLAALRESAGVRPVVAEALGLRPERRRERGAPLVAGAARPRQPRATARRGRASSPVSSSATPSSWRRRAPRCTSAPSASWRCLRSTRRPPSSCS